MNDYSQIVILAMLAGIFIMLGGVCVGLARIIASLERIAANLNGPEPEVEKPRAR